MKKKLILFLVIVLGLITIVGCGKDNNKSKNDNKEVEITDQKLINTLEQNTKILYLLGSNLGGQKGTFFEKDNNLEDFTTDEKLTAILIYANMNSDKITHETMTIDDVKTYYPGFYEKKLTEEDYKYTFYKVDGTTVSNLYSDLFNKSLTNYDNNMLCPKAEYYKDINKYIYITTCGNGSEDYLYTYNYKYTKDNNNAYVYVSIAVSSAKDGKLYSDFAMNNEYLESSSKFEITKDNYQDLDKYKITLNKKGSTYAFEKVEKISD